MVKTACVLIIGVLMVLPAVQAAEKAENWEDPDVTRQKYEKKKVPKFYDRNVIKTLYNYEKITQAEYENAMALVHDGKALAAHQYVSKLMEGRS